MKLDKNDLKSALAFARFQKNRYWKLQSEKMSQINNALNTLSLLEETTLTKVQLRDLMNMIFAYMKAHNLFVYYRDDCTRINLKLSGGEENGDINNPDCED